MSKVAGFPHTIVDFRTERFKMKNSILLIVSMFFVGCSEPTPNRQACMADFDCRNGEHCNLFFGACEADTYDAALADSANVSDAGFPEVDSSVDSSDSGQDSGLTTSDPDALVLPPDAFVPPSNLALRFDGEADKVTLPVIAGLGQNFTFEAWVRPTSAVYLSDVGGFIFQRRASSEDVTLFFSRNSDSRFGFQVNGTIVRAERDSSLNEWHHVAGVLQNGDVSIFVDGELEGRVSGLARVRWDIRFQEFTIGREGFEADIHRGVFIGEMDEIRLSSVSRYTDATYEIPTRLEADSTTIAMFELNDGDSMVRSSVGAIVGSLTGGAWISCER